MTSASRDYAGEPDALHRRSLDAARDAFAGSTSLAVAEEDSSVEEALAEFDRRVALLKAETAGDLRFELADFADAERQNGSGAEPLSHVLQHAGPMPADVAEECVRGTLDALRAAHDRRWSHGALSLHAFALDSCGGVRLTDVGRSQRAGWIAAADGLNLEASPLAASEALDRLWNETFLNGAAEDFRRLTTHVVVPLLQGIDGERPAWAERVPERLDALDGTIGSLEDVDHAWRVLGAAFDEADAVKLPSAVERYDVAPAPVAAPDAVVESPTDGTPDEVPHPSYSLQSDPTSRVMLLWLCVVGGLAALAGTIAAAAIAL